MEDYKEILNYLNEIPAVSGFEKKLSERVKTQFEKFCNKVYVDKFYNVVGIKRVA